MRKRNSSEWCHFVRSNPDCRLEGGFLDYLDGVFCVFPPRLLPLAVTLYVRMGTGVMMLMFGGAGWGPHQPISLPSPTPQALWLLYLFVILGVTAEKL